MKILINAVSARAGGGVAYLVKLLEILPEMAPEIDFLAAVPDISFLQDIKLRKNLEIQVIRQASADFYSRYYWENTGLIELCHSWGADVLFCVANVSPLVDPGISVILMIQNVAPLTLRAIKMYRRFEPFSQVFRMLLIRWLTMLSLARAGRVIALSNATAKLIKGLNPMIESDVLYHGISENFNPNVARPSNSGTDQYFIYVSNLYVYKGLEYIVEALECDSSLPRVIVVGRDYDSNYVAYVKKLAEKARVAHRLIFIGPVPREELPGWYANASAMVYTSWCENCPNILLESMACGCPVVAMQIGPMPEICGDTGFYARPFSGKSLAVAMKQASAASSAHRARAIAKAAEFTWEKAMNRHLEIFRGLGKH
ncbi:MAG: glycosyltransferase family 4 protein [Candidatus Rifleibacteriota bacterium]